MALTRLMSPDDRVFYRPSPKNLLSPLLTYTYRQAAVNDTASAAEPVSVVEPPATAEQDAVVLDAAPGGD